MIIGLCGKKKVGKDLIGDVLKHDYGYELKAFATPLKELCSAIFNIELDILNNQELKNKLFETPMKIQPEQLQNMLLIIAGHYKLDTVDFYDAMKLVEKTKINSYRELLQFVGTDLIRDHIGEDVWTTIVNRECSNLENVVLTDCRFEQERKMIKDKDGYLILIERDTSDNDDHISENSLGERTEYDYIIENNGTIQELCEKVHFILSDIYFNK